MLSCLYHGFLRQYTVDFTDSIVQINQWSWFDLETETFLKKKKTKFFRRAQVPECVDILLDAYGIPNTGTLPSAHDTLVALIAAATSAANPFDFICR